MMPRFVTDFIQVAVTLDRTSPMLKNKNASGMAIILKNHRSVISAV